MSSPILIVSDPPHHEVDLGRAAAIVGLNPYETRLKLIFPAPEVLAGSDMDRAKEIAASYESVGVRVTIIDGQELVDLPWPEPVSSFEFAGKGLTAHLRTRDVEIPYDSSVVGVYCKPPDGFSMKPADARIGLLSDGMAVVEAIEWMANLDLYFVRDGALRRISIVQDLTDFSGLGPMKKRTAAENMAATLAGVRHRFALMRLDARLENVRPRRRFVGGDSAINPDLRKRYSFGTLLLRHILASISPVLRDLTQYELGSRLGYITSRGPASASRSSA